MTESDVKKYVKTQLGISWVDVEAEDKDIKTLITMALDKLAPYYEGHRLVQASGKVIDLSNHHPLAIEKVYNTKNEKEMNDIFNDIDYLFDSYHKFTDAFNEYDGIINVYYLNNNLDLYLLNLIV